MIEIKLEGFEELANQFAGYAQALRSEILRNATLAAARAVETELLARTPINTDGYTEGSDRLAPGVLAGSIDVRPIAGGDTPAFAVGPGRETSHVARWVEYGHRLVKGGRSRLTARGATGPGREIDQVQAWPFLRPAQEASQGPALDAFEAELERSLIR